MAYDAVKKKEELVEHLTKAVLCVQEINHQEELETGTPADNSLASTLTNAIGTQTVQLAGLKSQSSEKSG